MGELTHIKEHIGKLMGKVEENMHTFDMIKHDGKRYRLHKIYGLVEFGDACKLCDFNNDDEKDNCLKSGVDCRAPYGYFKLDEKFKF